MRQLLFSAVGRIKPKVAFYPETAFNSEAVPSFCFILLVLRKVRTH